MLKKSFKKILEKVGLEINRIPNTRFPVEFSAKDIEIFEYVHNRDLTMIGRQRMFSNMLIAKYISENNIYGDFVECGVWRGGSTLLVKMIFEEYGNNSKVWLFDTFLGMTEPSDIDRNFKGRKALDTFKKAKEKEYTNWCYATLEEVKNNFKDAGISLNECNFIKGDVSKTIPENIDKIRNISFLRLDTDWYNSTKIELNYLYPKVIKNGFLVIDDYGHWTGSRLATDEYFNNNNIKSFKNIIDISCRMIRV